MVPTDAGRPAEFELLSRFALPPGRYELRLGAHRLADGVAGSVYADVEVPDFAKAPLSLSGVMIEVSPQIAAAPGKEFATLLPIVPTSSREFRTTDRASGLLRIYQGGEGAVAPVTIVVRLVNDRDEEIVNSVETLAPDRFGGATRAADYRFVIPTASLAPGEYLVTFDVTAGAVTARVRSVSASAESYGATGPPSLKLRRTGPPPLTDSLKQGEHSLREPAAERR